MIYGGIKVEVSPWLPPDQIVMLPTQLTVEEQRTITAAAEKARAEGGDVMRARVDALIATGAVRVLHVGTAVAAALAIEAPALPVVTAELLRPASAEVLEPSGEPEDSCE